MSTSRTGPNSSSGKGADGKFESGKLETGGAWFQKVKQTSKISRKDITLQVEKTIKHLKTNIEETRRRSSLRKSILAPFSKVEGSAISVYSQANQENNNNGKSNQEPKSDAKAARTKRVLAFLEGKPMQSLLAFATVIALFGPDLWVLCMDPSLDMLLDILLCLTFFLFLLEMTLSCVYRKDYRWSFYFFLDVVAMLSLIVDISFFWDMIFPYDDGAQDNLAILRAGRLVRTGTRTTRALRLLKFIRFARVIRLFRLIAIIRSQVIRRYLKKGDDPTRQAPNKLGVKLADLLGKRVIIGAIMILFIYPYLDDSEINRSPKEGLEMLEISFRTTVYGQLQEQYLESHRTTVFLQIEDHVLVNKTSMIDGSNGEFRVRDRMLIREDSESGKATVIYNDYEREQLQAGLNIILTLLLTFLFGLSAFFFNRDVHQTVVRPIIKTTKVIRKLAKTLFLLTNDQENEDDDLLEVDFIDSIVEKLVTFFNVDAKANKNNSPAFGNKPGSVHPQSNYSVAKFNTILDKDAEPDDEDEMMMLELQGKRRSDEGSIPDSEITVLNSFEEFWEDKQALQYFKVFLTSEFAVESLMFIDEVEKYIVLWDSLSQQHWEIIRMFVDERASFQVNISDALRNTILRHDGTSFDQKMYDAAKQEIFKQLERDNFPRFKKSELAQELIRSKKKELAKARSISSSTCETPQNRAERKGVKTLVRSLSTKVRNFTSS